MDFRRLGWLPGLLPLVVAGLWLATPAAAAGGPVAPAAGWSWPLAPRPVVAARFEEPAGPYAPGHRGVDLLGPPGWPVLAAADGVVAFAGRVAGRGVVSVDHPGGLRTTYEPVAARVVRGDRVRRAGVLGVLEPAPSHCAALACLHWGLRRGEAYLDPLTLVGAVRVRLLPVWGAKLPDAVPAGGWAARSNRVPGADTEPAPEDKSPPVDPAAMAVGAGGLAVGAGGLALAGLRAARGGRRPAGGSRRVRCRPAPRPGRTPDRPRK